MPGDLRRLILSHNTFQGELPSPFPNLQLVEELAIDNNNLSGTLPDLNHLSTPRLITLNLARQQHGLHGTLPAQYRDLPYLHNLDVSDNNLTGTIPYIGKRETLILSQNCFTGHIPPGFGGKECEFVDTD